MARRNFYKEELELVENAMLRERQTMAVVESGFWRRLKLRKDSLVAEFRSYQAQLHELISENSDEFCRHEYLDICEAIGE